MTEYVCRYRSPLGPMTLISDGTALTGLRFDGEKRGVEAPDAVIKTDLPVFARTMAWLDVYFGGRAPEFTPPLSIKNETPFAKAVREIMMTIPYGQTMTYGEIAAKIAGRKGVKRVAARAVGGAAGRNPVCLIVPCHRVVGAGGALTGYAAGVDKKAALLEMERQSC